MTNLANQYFLLPPQPDPNDRRPRNAFGFLTGFGKAATAYYKKKDRQAAKAKAKVFQKEITMTIPRDVYDRIRQFANENGRTWKSKLRQLWNTGKDEALLRQARNIVGPSGLDKIKTNDKDQCVAFCPSANLDTGGNEPFEIWFDRGHEDYEVIGGGQTEAEAWASALEYLLGTPKESW